MLGNITIPVQNMLIRPNNTFIYNATYLDANNAIIDTTGYIGFMQFRAYPGAPRVIFQASTANGMISFSGTNGGYGILIPASSTVSMPLIFQKAYYDLLFQRLDGTLITVLQGLVELDRAVTLITTSVNNSIIAR